MQHTPALWLFLHYCSLVHSSLCFAPSTSNTEPGECCVKSNGLAICYECTHTDQVAACILLHPACMFGEPFAATNQPCRLTC